MTPAQTLTIAAAALLLASSAGSRGNVEAGEGALPSFDFENISDRTETLVNVLTEQPADIDMDTASQNIAAFLGVIRQAEGTANAADPYRVCFGYGYTIQNLAQHPAVSGEWRGERLADDMCRNAGFGPGCVSTAAGAYQIIKPTWLAVSRALVLGDFSPGSQDAACIELVRRRGALEDVKAGRIEAAVSKCRNEWASLPGNNAKQGQRSIGQLVAWYQQNGGYTA